MKYSLRAHGDLLERNVADFVAQYFPYYESVWSMYIGHNGQGNMAAMLEYPDPEKRTKFAENSYTVLQSAAIIQDILDSEIFMAPHKDYKTVLEFHKSMVAFYALVGRIRDCTGKAALCLGLPDIESELKTFYDERNIILHGRTIPLNLDEIGLAKMPDLRVWDDKASNWADVKAHKKQYVEDNIRETFLLLMILINGIYGRIFNELCQEFKSLDIKLEVAVFEYFDLAISGSTQPPMHTNVRQVSHKNVKNSYTRQRKGGCF